MQSIKQIILLLLIFLVFLPAFTANIKTKNPLWGGKERVEMLQKQEVLKKESPYSHLKWQYLGPTNISGRCTDVEAVSPRGKQYTIWIGSASGGVWKSTNEGTTFESVFDNLPTASIGDIAIDPQNADIVWVGTGEANIFRSSLPGCGIFKTTNSGKTWERSLPIKL